jgi:hypothetical protein
MSPDKANGGPAKALASNVIRSLNRWNKLQGTPIATLSGTFAIKADRVDVSRRALKSPLGETDHAT